MVENVGLLEQLSKMTGDELYRKYSSDEISGIFAGIDTALRKKEKELVEKLIRFEDKDLKIRQAEREIDVITNEILRDFGPEPLLLVEIMQEPDLVRIFLIHNEMLRTSPYMGGIPKASYAAGSIIFMFDIRDDRVIVGPKLQEYMGDKELRYYCDW